MLPPRVPRSSKIRIRDGRAKPIDLLAKYIGAEDDDLVVEMHEPYTFLNGLTVADMEDLLEDIQVRSPIPPSFPPVLAVALPRPQPSPPGPSQGVHGAGAGQERRLLARHDHHHRG